MLCFPVGSEKKNAFRLGPVLHNQSHHLHHLGIAADGQLSSHRLGAMTMDLSNRPNMMRHPVTNTIKYLGHPDTLKSTLAQPNMPTNSWITLQGPAM